MDNQIFERIGRRPEMKRMMHLLKWLLFIVGLMILQYPAFSVTLERTSSNTILFTDDYSTGEYVDPNGWEVHIARQTGGTIQNNGINTWGWDGPTTDIAVSENGVIYAVGEWTVYSGMVSDPPFNTSSGDYRPDLFLMRFDTSGNKKWSQAIRVRTMDDTNVSFYNSANESKYPQMTTDTDDSVYLTWVRRDHNNSYHTFVQRVNSDGSKPWGNEVKVADVRSYTGAGVAVVGDSVFVLWQSGANVYAAKLNKSDGSVVTASQQVNTGTYSTVYHPRLVAGSDGYLYAAWVNTGGVDIYGQRFDTNLNNVTWGSDANDKRLNEETGVYSYGYFWYGWTEDELAMDMDSSTNLYVAWSSKRSGAINAFAQKIDCSAGGFTREWTNGGIDAKISEDGSLNGDVYVDIDAGSSYIYASYITHDDGENDHMILQRLSKVDGSKQWSPRKYTGLGHHGRIDVYQNYAYVTSTSIRVRKYDFNQTQIWDTYFLDRSRSTRFYYSTYPILPGTVHTARVIQSSTIYQPDAFFQYWVTSDGGNTVFGPLNITNETGEVSFTNITNVGNDFRVYVVGDNSAQLGMNYIAMDELKVEATKIHLGDALVGKAPDGSDAIGDLVLNSDSSGQSLNAYVYNNGTSAANAYFFIKNNGNFSYSSNTFKIQGTAGNADWTVSYWLCNPDGSTNTNITSGVTSGLITNLAPFTNANQNWLRIKAFLTPSVSLSAGDTYPVSLEIYGNTSDTDVSWVLHDQVTINGIVSAALPDLEIYSKSGIKGYDLRNDDGSGQTEERIGDTNVTLTYQVRLRNAGGQDSIKTSSIYTGSSGWTVRYLTNGIDVTAIATNTFISNNLNTGEYFSNITVNITPDNTIGVNASLDIPMRSVSYKDSSKVDRVIARYICVRTKPDLIVNATGYGVYSTNETSQLVTSQSDNGLTNDFIVVLSNAGSYAMDFRVSAVMSNALNPGWKVWILEDGTQDVIAEMTNGYYTVSNLAAGSSQSFTVRIQTPLMHNAGANEVMGVYLLSKGEGDYANANKWDQVGIQHKTVSSRVDETVDGSASLVFEDPASSQYVFKYIAQKTNFTLAVSNSANSAYDIVTKLQSAGFGFDVVYTNDGNDITTVLLNGWTNQFTAGEVKTIEVYLNVTTASVGDTYDATLRSYSLMNTSDVDEVRFKAEQAVAPDLLIKKSSETAFHGDGAYGSDPTIIDQESASTFPQDSTNWYRYVMRVQNDRPSAESQRVRSTFSTNAWEVRFFRYIGATKSTPNLYNDSDWSDITVNTTNSGYVFANVPSADYEVVMTKVRAKDATNEGDTLLVDLIASGEDTSYRDVVRVHMTYGMGLPDLVYNEGDVQSTNWNDLYVSDYASAVATNYPDKSKGTLYHFLIQNDSLSNPSSFTVRGTGSVGSWKVQYFDTNNNDITSFVIGDGYSLFVSNQSQVSLGVKISASNSQLGLGSLTNVDIYASTELGELKDYLRIRTVLTDLGLPDLVFGNNADGVRDSANPAVLGTNLLINWGETLSFPVIIQNDRNVAESFKIYGSENFLSWGISYETNGVDLTADLTNRYTTGQPYLGGLDLLIPANSSVTLDTKVTLASNCGLEPGEEHSFDIYAYSEGRLVRDGVQIRAIVSDSGTPDLVASSDSGWNNVYENSPSIQSLQTNTEKGWMHSYEFYLQNDRSLSEALKFRGIGNTNNWQINYAYYDVGLSGWSNITAMATNSNFIFLMPTLSSVTLKVETFLPTNASNPLESTLDLGMQTISWMGFVTDSVQLVYKVKDMSIPDLSFTNGLWNDTYESVSVTPASTSNVAMEKAQTNIYYLWIENDSTVRTNTFYVSAPPTIGDWQIGYTYSNEISSTFSNVTYEITHHESLVNLPPLGKQLLKIQVSVPTNVSMQTNSGFNLDLDVESFFGQKHDLGRIALRYVDKGNPDLLLGTNRIGDGWRETSASLQKLDNNMEWGNILTIPVFVQNDRTDKSESLTLHANYPGNGDFVVKYWKISGAVTNEITSFLTNYYGLVESVPMQTELTLLVQMDLASNATSSTNSVNDQHLWMNVVSYVGAYTDTVALNYHIADLSKPDIYLAGISSWSNFSENPAVQQVSNVSLEMGHTNVIEYYIANGRMKDEEFKFKISKSAGTSKYWSISHGYFDGSWSNVAGLVTNTWTNLISGNSTKKMRVSVFVPYDDGQSFTNNIGETGSLDFSLQSWMGYEFDKTHINYTLADLGKPNIRKTDASWAVVENSPVNQVEVIPIEKGLTNTYELMLTNERSDFSRFKVLATVSEWNTEYWISNVGGWTNVTAQITNGFFEYFDANESKPLKIVQFAPYADSNAQNAIRDLVIQLKSYRGTMVDAVKLSYQVKDFSKPDILMGTNQFADTYSFYGDAQYTNIYIEKAEHVDFTLNYQNDSDRSYQYILQASHPNIDWTLTYTITNNGSASNITTLMTNSGFSDLFTNGQQKTGTLGMTLLESASMTSNDILTNLVKMFSLAKLKIEQVGVLYHLIDRGNPFIAFTNGSVYSNLLMKRKDTNSFDFVLTNNRTDTRFASEHMLVKLNPDLWEGWNYRVLLGTTDVTADATNGGVLCTIVNGGGTNLSLEIAMSASNTNASGITNQIGLELYSQGRQKKDNVTINVIKQEPRPDLTVISISGEGVVGEDVYTSEVTNQNILGYVIVSKSATYSVILENDDVIPDTIDLQMSGVFNTNKWVLSVEDDDLGIEVSSNFMEGSTYTIDAGKHKMFILTVTAQNTVGMNETNSVIFTAISRSDTNKVDRIQVSSVRIPVTVEGVIKSQAGIPLDNAKVQFTSLFSDQKVGGTTDQDGKYSLKMIPGTFRMIVSRSGYVDFSGTVTVKEVRVFAMADVSLLPVNLDQTVFDAHSFPNPVESRGQATIVINHLEDGLLRLEVYDLKGRLLKTFFNEEKAKGVYTVEWDTRSDDGLYLTKGVYFMVFHEGNQVKVKKIFVK